MNGIAKQSGLTLVELVVASGLGLLLTLGVARLFVSSSDSFRMAEEIGRIQESGRLAQDILGRTIRSADYWGCLNFADVDSVLDESHAGYDPAIHDFSSPDAVQFDIGDGTDAAAGTAVIQLKGARSPGISMTGMNASSAVIDVSRLPAGLLDTGGVALLTDCNNGVVFQLSGVNETSLKLQHNTGSSVVPGNIKNTSGSCPNGSNSANCFPDTYNTGDIFVPFSERFYIRDDNGRRSLVYEGIGGGGLINRQEIVADVIDMQMQVGSGPQGDNVINSWTAVDAANLATINNTSATYVKAVRVSLLVRSPEDRVAGSLQDACFPAWTDCSGGNNWTPANADDRHYYRVYTSTYSIRNRLLSAAP
ncbi:PilW family protein [Marinobacter sp. CA1]|uniref:PilW family protein n=1 Tax=Marinobacter sp. CA1 TaxID=2817656 RepID=UPI001D073632|nr:PilW family protein [Marinobacter sp. CA1]UDL04373.1 PilW family protein [Marinobacter sp. CA1]